ncbi:MAG TPA: hypothetical protein VGX69_10020 [Solirubrobacteraceae bacterium]|jgi:MFS family permease|nr:hypothetical protein [Solirubrobacteraceae bacterium]
MLVGAGVLQGLGGAVISPASLAIVTTSFREQRERSRALASGARWAASAARSARCSAAC